MRKLVLIIQSIFHKQEKHQAWSNKKYCLVLTHKRYVLPHALGEEYAYLCVEFETKQKATSYLDKFVSKSDRKNCLLYKEITIPQQKKV